jgi:hypothetical protein
MTLSDSSHYRLLTINREMCSSTFVDANGRPSFQALQHRAAHPGHVIAFYAFDLLHLDGHDLTSAPLQERRARLPQVVNDSGVLLSIELPGTSQQVIEAVTSLGLRRRSSAPRGISGAQNGQGREGHPSRSLNVYVVKRSS